MNDTILILSILLLTGAVGTCIGGMIGAVLKRG